MINSRAKNIKSFYSLVKITWFILLGISILPILATPNMDEFMIIAIIWILLSLIWLILWRHYNKRILNWTQTISVAQRITVYILILCLIYFIIILLVLFVNIPELYIVFMIILALLYWIGNYLLKVFYTDKRYNINRTIWEKINFVIFIIFLIYFISLYVNNILSS